MYLSEEAILQDEVAEFLGGILSHGPMVQESVVVDLSDLDLRKHKKTQQELQDELDGEDFGSQAMVKPFITSRLPVTCHYESIMWVQN